MEFGNKELRVVAVPVRGAGCIVEWYYGQPRKSNVAVPVRGAGCIQKESEREEFYKTRCCPREGCGLHPVVGLVCGIIGIVAVPVRGAGCIFQDPSADHHGEPVVAVPVRGAGCIIINSMEEAIRYSVAVPVRGAGCICPLHVP
mgnify:CR=1 FL=1